MKKLLFAASSLILASQAMAFDGVDEKYRKTKPGDIYFGAGASVIDIDGFSDDARAIGGTVGVNVINRDFGTIALDTFFARTIDAATNQAGVEADVNIAGIFAAYRTPTKLFGKVKAGGVFSELDRTGSNLDDDTSEFAWGVGVGAEIYYGVDLELEFTEISDEASAVSISLILND